MNVPSDPAAAEGSPREERAYPRDYRRFGTEGVIPMLPAGASASPRFQSFRALVRRTETEPVLPVKALVFHCSRCGSTLLTRLLELDRGLRVFAEPGALPRFIRAHAAALAQAGAIAELRGFIRAFGLAPEPGEHGLILKLTSYSLAYLPAFRLAFPDVPFVYLFRDPVEVVASLGANPPHFLRDDQRANLAAEFGPDMRAAIACERVSWYARYLDRNLRTALAQRREFAFVVDYARHAAAFVSLLRHFRTGQAAWTDEDVARVLGRHSKNPHVSFGPAQIRTLPAADAVLVQSIAGEAHALWQREAAARSAG